MTVLADRRSPVPEPTGPPDEAVAEASDGHVQGHGWFGALARFTGRRRRTVMLVWLAVVLLAAPLAVTSSGALSGAGWEAQGSTAQEVRDELRRDFPQLGAEAAIVMYHQDAPVAGDPAGVQAVVAHLDGASGATTVVDPLAQPAESGLVSPDGRTVLIPVGLAAEEDADLPESAGALIDHVADLDVPAGARVEVLLFIAFGSAVAAGLPLLLAVAGIAGGAGDVDDRGGRVRRELRRHRVPARDRRRAHRRRPPGLRRRMGTAVLLRPALRALDGLPAVPAGGDPGALRGHR